MAKKTKLSTDKFDIDSELDFGDFGLEDIDSQMNPQVKKGSKSRQAITDVFKGTISGAKDEFRNPSFLAKVAKDSLPSSYGSVLDAGGQITASTRQLYDEAVREIKPQLGAIAKKIDRLVPDEQKRLKKFTSKAKDLLGDGEQYKGPSKEQLQDQGVANALAQVFGAQQELDQKDKARANAEAHIKDRVEGKRFESNFGLLSSIAESGQRIASYTERVTQAYQKKSLELQYRSYFVQSELLQLNTKFYEVFKNQNEAIAKNTALPDYVKINMTERIKQEGKNKLASAAHGAVFGPNSALGKGLARVGEEAKGYLSGIGQGLQAAMMGIDMAEGMAESVGDMGMSKSQMGGMMLGGKMANMFGGAFSKQFKKWIENSPKTKKFVDAGHTASGKIANLSGSIKTLQEAEKYQEWLNAPGAKGFLGRFGDWFLNNFKDQKESRKLENPNSMSALSLGAKFDGRTQRSIVEVIPGYLALILQELNNTRSGTENAELQVYDFAKGKFGSKKEVYQTMNKAFSKKIKSSMQGYHVEQMSSEIMGGKQVDIATEQSIQKFFSDVNSDKKVEQTVNGKLKSKHFKKLDPETQKIIEARLNGNTKDSDETAIQLFLLNLSREPDFDYTPENIKKHPLFTKFQEKQPKAAKIVLKFFQDKIESGDDKANQQRNLRVRMSTIKSSAGNIDAEIQESINAGYGDILKKEKVIFEDEDGNYTVNEEKYYELIDRGIVTSDKNKKTNITKLDQDSKSNKTKRRGKQSKVPRGRKGRTIRDSDVNMKEDIKPLKPNRALEAIKNTKIYKWFYKEGQGDQDQHTGPMAQDVKKNMGEDSAPGGVKIDLTTMNGNNMAAIQELSDKQDSMLGGEQSAVGYLKGIGEDTSTIVKLLQGDGQGGTGAAKGDGSYSNILGSMFGPLGALVGKGGKDLFSAGTTVAKGVGKGIGAGAKGLSTAFDKIKDPATRTLSMIMNKAGEVSMKALELGNDAIFNKLPTGIGKLKEFGTWAKDQAKNLIFKARDVYIKGKSSPAIQAYLLKAGHYRDQATGKVLKNMRDLRNLKGNVVNTAGEVVLTIEDAAKGLFDDQGKKIKTGFEKFKSWALLAGGKGIARGAKFLSGAFKAGKGLLGGAADFASNMANSLFSGFKDLGFGSQRIYDVLVEMRDIMRGEDPGRHEDKQGFKDNFIGPMAQSPMNALKDKASGKINELTDKAKDLFGIGKEKVTENVKKAKTVSKKSARKAERKAKVKAAELLAAGKGKMGGKLGLLGKAKGFLGGKLGGVLGLFGGGQSSEDEDDSSDVKNKPKRGFKGSAAAGVSQTESASKPQGKATFNDRDGSGERDGGWKEQLKKREGQDKGNNKDALEADTEAKYRGKNIIDMMMDKAKGLLGGDEDSSLLDTALDLFDRDKKGNGKKLSKRAAKKAAAKAAAAKAAKVASRKAAVAGAFKTAGGAGGALLKKLPFLGAIFDTFTGTQDLMDDPNQEKGTFNSAWDYLSPFKYGAFAGKYANKGINEVLSGMRGKDTTLGASIGDAQDKISQTLGFSKDPMAPPTLEEINKYHADKKDGLNFKTMAEYESWLKTKKIRDTNLATKEAVAVIPPDASKTSVAPAAAAALPNTGVTPKAKDPTAVTPGGDPFTGEEAKEVKSPEVFSGITGQGGALGKLYMAEGAIRDGAGADQYMRLAPGVKLDSMNPSLLKNLRGMIQEYGETTGKTVTITSGSRTTAEQEALWRKDPKKAARPGRSLHEFGLAVDASSKDLDAMENAGLMRKYGFTRPVGGEKWHMEPAGIQTNLNLAKQDAGFAAQAVEASLFRGGGGVGSMDGTPLGKRNQEVALALLGASDTKAKTADNAAVTAALTPKVPVSNQTPSSTSSGGASPALASGNTISASVSQGNTYDKKNTLPQVAANGEFKPESPAASSGPGPIDTGDKNAVMQAIGDIAKKQGVDPNEAMTFAAVESSLNPNAKASSSSASGAFQFTNATWKEQMGKHGRKFGLDPNTPPTDLTASTLMATEYFKSNKKFLSSVKPNPNITDVYLAHFLGASGARKFLAADPSAIAAQVMPKAAKSNPNIFYSNGRPLTVAEVYSKIDAKLTKTARDYGISLPGNNALTTSSSKGSATTAASSSSSAGSTAVASSAGNSVSAVPTAAVMPKNVFGSQGNTAIASSERSNLSQGNQGAMADFGRVNDTLTKSLDVQTQMLEVLKTIAGSVDPEKLKQMTEMVGKMGKPAPSAQSSGRVQQVTSAIDLSRKSA